MRIAANRQGYSLGDGHLTERRLRIDNVLHGNNDLVDVFPMDLLPVLESFHHVVDELLRHLLLQPDSIILRLHDHGVDVEAFGGRRLLANLDGGEEVELPHDLLALGELDLGISVVGVELQTRLEVLQGLLRLENGRVCNSATEICLDKLWIQFDGFRGVRNRIAICFGLEVRLRRSPSVGRAHRLQSPGPP